MHLEAGHKCCQPADNLDVGNLQTIVQIRYAFGTTIYSIITSSSFHDDLGKELNEALREGDELGDL